MTDALAWVGIAAVSGGAGTVAWSAYAERGSPLGKSLSARSARLSDELSFLRVAPRGEHVAIGQALGVVSSLGLAWILEEPFLLAAALIVLIAPDSWISSQRTRRVQRIEEQLHSWMLSLANALKSTGALGDALRTSADMTGGPLGEEIDTVVKATALGSSIDQALLDAGARIRSVLVSSALGALVVGRATGGDLPALLEKTARSLREMQRLEGVLRAQTSGARAQSNVMLGMPFVIIVTLQRLDPGWFDPLSESPMGMILAAIAASLWIAAVLISRTILRVGL